MGPDRVRPGTVVAARFRLDELLEEHAGAAAWRAVDLALARGVAVHSVPAEGSNAALALTAARRAATVTEPRLARVLDAVEEDGFVHVVHEWCHGASLDLLLAHDVLEPRRAAWLVREVAEALAVAHRRGVPHGRLLPENVMVTDNGTVKVIGFVVAGALYGDATDSAGDLTNLGALLFAALTGRWPGDPESVVPGAPREHGRVLRARQVRAGVPRALDQLCDELLAPDQHRTRPETPAAVAAALSRYLGDTVGEVIGGVARPGGDAEATTVLPALPRPADDAEATQAAGFAALFDDTGVTPRPQADRPATPGSNRAPASGSPAGSAPDSATAAVPATAGAAREFHAPQRSATQVPVGWGPDRDALAPEPAPPPRPPVSPWIRMAGLIGALALVVLAAVIAVNLIGGGGDDAEPPRGADASTSRDLRALDLAAVTDFDPEQDGGAPEENPDLVPLATDADPSTAWTTVRYNDGPVLAPYKNGVGLLVDLGKEVEVGEVRVSLLGGAHDLEVLAAPEGSSAPTTTDGLTQVAQARGATGTVTLAAEDAVTARYLVIWLTALPAVSGGFQGQIAEVVVRG